TSTEKETPPEKINLKFASYFPTAASQSKLLEDFCADINERTNGRVTIDFYGGGSLLGATKVYDGVMSKVADIGFTHVEYTRGRFPVMEMLDLPHGYPSAWVGSHVANDFYREFEPEEWEGAHILWFNTSPINELITAEKRVTTLEDVKGLTIRGPGHIGDVVKALGGTPKPIPLMEAYEALARGVIDASMTPIETLQSFNLADAAKYVTPCWQVGNLYTFYTVMNEDVWDSLPSDVQNTFDEVCKEYEEKAAKVWNETDTVGAEFAVEEKGVEFVELAPGEVEKWKKAVDPLIEGYVEELESQGHSADKLQRQLDFINERIEYWTNKQAEEGVMSMTGPDEIRLDME
ncbi:MAG: TRAP transporter substrate-binding protein, partial [Dehalococcoidia bacterium]